MIFISEFSVRFIVTDEDANRIDVSKLRKRIHLLRLFRRIEETFVKKMSMNYETRKSLNTHFYISFSVLFRTKLGMKLN